MESSQENASRSDPLGVVIDAQLLEGADPSLVDSLKGSTGFPIPVILTSKGKPNLPSGGQIVEVAKRPVDRERLLRAIVRLDFKRMAA